MKGQKSLMKQLKCQRTSALGFYTRRESFPDSVSAIGSRDKQFALDNKRAARIKGRFCAMMLDAMIPVTTQKVDPQAIGGGIDNLQEPISHSYKLCGINETFEHRILDTLSIVVTGFGDSAKPPPAFHGRCGNIVGD